MPQRHMGLSYSARALRSALAAGASVAGRRIPGGGCRLASAGARARHQRDAHALSPRRVPGRCQSAGAALRPCSMPLETMVERRRSAPVDPDDPPCCRSRSRPGCYLLRMLELQSPTMSYRGGVPREVRAPAARSATLAATDDATRRFMFGPWPGERPTRGGSPHRSAAGGATITCSDPTLES